MAKLKQEITDEKLRALLRRSSAIEVQAGQITIAFRWLRWPQAGALLAHLEQMALLDSEEAQIAALLETAALLEQGAHWAGEAPATRDALYLAGEIRRLAEQPRVEPVAAPSAIKVVPIPDPPPVARATDEERLSAVAHRLGAAVESIEAPSRWREELLELRALAGDVELANGKVLFAARDQSLGDRRLPEMQQWSEVHRRRQSELVRLAGEVCDRSAAIGADLPQLRGDLAELSERLTALRASAGI